MINEIPAAGRGDATYPLRILALQLGFNLNLGGGRYDYEQLAALVRLGHKVRVVAPRFGRNNSTLPPGVEVRWIAGRGIRYPITWNVPFLLPTLQECRRWQPDVIRVHSPYCMGVAGLLAGRMTGVPVVASVLHVGDRIAAGRWVESRLIPRFDGALCISRATANALHQLGTPAGRIGWSHCGIQGVFEPGRAEAGLLAGLGLDLTTPYYLFVGNLIDRKNLAWLLGEVFASFCAAAGEGSLVIAGEGPCGEQLRELVRDLALGDRVVFTGRVGEVQQLALYRGASVFLFPSRMEGFGLAPAEAMACGTPAVVSDRGSLPELIRPGVTGFVLPIDQGPQPWVECLRRLAGDRVLRARIGAAATEDVRCRFTWDGNASRAAAFFTTLAARRRTR